MKFKHLRNFFWAIIIINSSCTPYKQVPYFQDLRRDTVVTEAINNFSPLTIHSGDLIGLNVTSLNADADLILNYNLVPQKNQIPLNNQTPVFGYLVDLDGNINLPLAGLVKVSGSTIGQASAIVESKLETYLSKPVANIRILNARVMVLGDVRNPGVYSIVNDRITLTEALSLAGDLNTTAVRQNLLLIRESDGQREYITIDMTSKKLFTSPYYYLKNGDLLYAVPNRSRTLADDAFISKFGVVLSALSVLITTLSYTGLLH